MKIKLLENIRYGMTGEYGYIPQKYYKGDIIEVIPQTNLPPEAEILFWIWQDGWENHPAGFPIYKTNKHIVLDYVPEHLKKWQMPKSDYGGDDMSAFYQVLGHTRDSETLEESNWIGFLRDHPENFDEETNKGILVARFGHWGCGWFELILVHETDFELLKEMDELREALDDYPVYDDELFSQMEMDEQFETVKSEFEYIMRHNDFEIEYDLEDEQIENMASWFCSDANSSEDFPNEDDFVNYAEKVLHWKKCSICEKYNDENPEEYRKVWYDERYDCCGCQMELGL